jgi:hypothetical protein
VSERERGPEAGPESEPYRHLTRRRFVAGVGAAVAVASLAPIDGVFAAPDGSQARLPLEYASFAACLGETFQVRHPDGGLNLSLVKVSNLEVQALPAGAHPSATRAESFRLTFSATGGRRLEQGTHIFRNRHFGTFALFVTQGHVDDRIHQYIAVFHRLAK